MDTFGSGHDEKAGQKTAAWDAWLKYAEQKTIAAGIDVSEATISEWFASRKSADSEQTSTVRRPADFAAARSATVW